MIRKCVLLACVLSLGVMGCAAAQDGLKSTSGALGEASATVDSGQKSLAKAQDEVDETNTKLANAEASAKDVAAGNLVKVAAAALEPRSGELAGGVVTITETKIPNDDGTMSAQISIAYEISGLKPGKSHGFHIHEKGDCSAKNAASAQNHFNPGETEHGALDAENSHAGDLGNIVADKDGNALGVIEKVTKITLNPESPNSVLGRAFIVHKAADDLTTQPTGNSGARIACGVIKNKE